MPVIRDMSVLEQLIEGVVPPDDDAVKSVIERNPNVWDQSGGDLRRAMLAATRARRSRRPRGHRHRAQGSAGGLDRAACGQPDARPGAHLDGRDAEHPGRADRPSSEAADAAGTAIEAVRAATGAGRGTRRAQLLVTTFSLMLARGQRAGPFREAEEALRTALANAGADDWALRRPC